MTNRELEWLLCNIKLDPRTHSGVTYVEGVPMEWVREQVNKWGRKNLCTPSAQLEGRLIRIDVLAVPKGSPLRMRIPRVSHPWHTLKVNESIAYPEDAFPNVGNLRSRVYQFAKRSGQKLSVMHSHRTICIKRTG